MEARTIGFGITAAVCGMFGCLIMYSMERDHRESERVKASNRLKDLLADLASAEEVKVRATTRLDAIKTQATASKLAAKSLEDELTATKTELQAVEKELEEIRARAAISVKQKATALERNRAAAVGTSYERLALANGKVLLGAKLTKFTPQELSFTHSMGRSTIRWSQLPPELIERFEMGSESEGEVIVEPEIEEPEVLPPPGPSLQERANQAMRLNQAKLQLAKLENAIHTLSSKAAPNPLEIQKLLDKKATLEIRVKAMEAAQFQ